MVRPTLCSAPKCSADLAHLQVPTHVYVLHMACKIYQNFMLDAALVLEEMQEA